MEKQGLRKEIKLSGMIAMAAGGMIAAWMVEIKYWFEIGGVGAALSLLTCAVLILPLALMYTEMTSMMPYAGGQNIWITNAFGFNTGFASCWMIMLLYIMAMPTVSMGIASMLAYLFPISTTQIKVIAAILLVCWYFLTNFELKLLTRLQNVFFWSTLVIAVVADIIFIASGQWSFDNLNWFPNGVSGYTAGIGLLIMKFVGFDLIPQLSEEANFPKKDIWKAFVGALGCTVLVYGLAVIAIGGIVSLDWINEVSIVDPKVADLLGLHWLGIIIVVMGVLTCITTLSSFWLSASRILYGAAKQHQFTSRFAKLNKHGQPQFANLIVGILSVYFTVFAPEAWVNYIYVIYGVAAGAVYLMVTLSFLRIRKTHPEWERPYKAPAGAILGIIGIVFCIWILWTNGTAMGAAEWIVLAIYAAAGLILWGYAKAMQKKNPIDWAPVVLNPDTVTKEEADQITG